MKQEENNPLNIIKEANSKTLKYFNKIYVEHLETVQSLKTELFELEIQIETLEKTKELYSHHVDNRRSVFSPLSGEDNQSMSRGNRIAMQIKDLEEARESMKKKITGLEQDILFYKEELALLSKAEKCIKTVLVGNSPEESPSALPLEDAIEFVETEDTEEKTTHYYNMLKLEDYEHYRCAASLDQNVKQELIANLNKLDVLKWLLHSDLGRARITLQELHSSQKHILNSLDDVLGQLHYPLDQKQPVSNRLQQLVKTYQDAHPECIIDFSCDCAEHELHLPQVINIRLIQMLNEIFDNIFKHSNANRVTAKVFMNSRLIDVHVNDNGVGIPEDYLERSEWCSGLHKLHETIYQLDGKLQIQGDLISGTNVRFSFPVKG